MRERCQRLLLVAQRQKYSVAKPFTRVGRLTLYEHNNLKGLDVTKPLMISQSFCEVPAIKKWFHVSREKKGAFTLDNSYLKEYEDTLVPLELTRPPLPTQSSPEPSFERFSAPLSLLISHISSPSPPSVQLYLAQHSLTDLPLTLQSDLPTPDLLSRLGRGDVYASSLWLGRPPTRTPLHRDPNPNLFVQLTGRKIVRLLSPDVGRGVFERARMRTGSAMGGANMRGEEMMAGREMEELERVIWEDSEMEEGVRGVEAEVSSGDGLYIPLGWWHAVRSVGDGVNASVNWWFR